MLQTLGQVADLAVGKVAPSHGLDPGLEAAEDASVHEDVMLASE